MIASGQEVMLKVRFIRTLLALLVLIFIQGCATLAIPAIDPSGNRIFAPTPTQLTLPQLHGPNGTSLVPNASFPQPLPPAACLQGPTPVTPTPVGSGSNDRGRCGQILLTPTRIVAPVGGEVVLLAGVCGEDGFLVSGEPIEWMLSPDSVGELIEVGDDMKGKRKSFFTSHRQPKNAVEKLDVDFARGRTSAEPGVITRGSQRQSDDLPIKKGQTWVSLTSPTEGLSRVTVLAPDSDVWDRRRQTATIYWVDAEWQFPSPQNLRVGQIANLSTRVMKAEGFAPAENWIVKYRLMTPEVGQFVGISSSAGGTDVRVDADGKANIQLANPTNKPGTAIVAIEVARPAQPEEKMPELPLGRGQTMVTWSAPVLQLRVNHNDTTNVGKAVDFQVQLLNTGNMNAENVSLVMDLKNGGLQSAYISQAPTNQTNTGAVWNIGVLRAQELFETIVRITPMAESDNRIEFTATASPDITEKAVTGLLAVKPTVDLRFAPAIGLDKVEVGQSTVFEILATNTGRETINNLILTVDADTGLQSTDAGPDSGSNRVAREVSYLPPGQTQSVGLRFIARRAGELGAKVVATVNGIPLAERSTFVRASEPIPRRPGMSAEILPTIAGKNTLAQGESVTMNGVIRNTGETRLTNLQILMEYDPSLSLTQLSQGGDNAAAARQVVWNIPVLEPQLQVAVQASFQSSGASAQPAIRLSARSSEAINATETFTFGTASGGVGGIPNGVMPPSSNATNTNELIQAANNRWSLLIQPIDSNVSVGERARYDITFRNNSNQPEENVELNILLPQGMAVVSLSTGDGSPVNSSRSDDGRILSIEPIQFLRAGEAVRRIVELQHDVAGSNTLQVQVKSVADAQGTLQQSRITVRPRL